MMILLYEIDSFTETMTNLLNHHLCHVSFVRFSSFHIWCCVIFL